MDLEAVGPLLQPVSGQHQHSQNAEKLEGTQVTEASSLPGAQQPWEKLECLSHSDKRCEALDDIHPWHSSLRG